MAALPADSPAAPLRRVYGRGLFDGLRMAGIDEPEKFLDAMKAERIGSRLDGIARKALDAVPIEHPWDLAQIVSDITRTTGSRPDTKTVKAALGALVGQGLVLEPRDGRFVRVKIRPTLAAVPPAPVKEEKPMPAPTVVSPPSVPKREEREEREPLARMASMASTLRELARQADNVAEGLETVALEVAERMERIHADGDKLRQLQALLKSIGQ